MGGLRLFSSKLQVGLLVTYTLGIVISPMHAKWPIYIYISDSNVLNVSVTVNAACYTFLLALASGHTELILYVTRIKLFYAHKVKLLFSLK